MEDKKIKILFVCNANQNRSPTAEKICREIAKQNKLGIEASSAGIFFPFNIKLKKELKKQPDYIFVMEQHIKDFLIKKYSQQPNKIFNLNIPDIYSKNDPELEGILRRDLIFHFYNTINLPLYPSF